MSDPTVAKYIDQLNDTDVFVRYRAAEALGEIGDASAVPALIEALKGENESLHLCAAVALKRIGAAAAPALLEALRDRDAEVRWRAAFALADVGVAATPALLAGLRSKDVNVRENAAFGLLRIGGSVSLPRKILASPAFSAQERIDLLEKLRRVSYRDAAIAFRYEFPDTRVLCQEVLWEEDADARAGAVAVLKWLDGDRHLLRPAQATDTLLLPVEGGNAQTPVEILVQSSDEPDTECRS